MNYIVDRLQLSIDFLSIDFLLINYIVDRLQLSMGFLSIDFLSMDYIIDRWHLSMDLTECNIDQNLHSELHYQYY